MSRRRSWNNEHGFTLPEVMITIILMGIVFAIATSTWFGIVESRRVDSATNQLAADLRLAHSMATNRLTDWRVVLAVGSQDYQLVKPSPPSQTINRSLPDDTEVGTSMTVNFRSNGSAQVISGSGNTIVVRSTDGDPQHTIEFNSATSRIQIDP